MNGHKKQHFLAEVKAAILTDTQVNLTPFTMQVIYAHD